MILISNNFPFADRELAFMKSICDQMFLSHALPDGTLLAGSGIQYGRDEDYPGGSLWYYFDLFNPDLHDGNIARFWGRFPDLNKDEETIEFDAMLQASGFSEKFLTSNPHKDNLNIIEYVRKGR